MFTGIITDLGKVKSFVKDSKGAKLVVETRYKDLILGESVANNGACLTVETISPEGLITFWLSLETLDRCAKDKIKEGAEINLERALRMDERLSGHFVQGHVDGTGKVVEIKDFGDGHSIKIFLPTHFRENVIEKGSIAIDGISLTINSVSNPVKHEGKDGFEIGLAIIPHTWENTNLKQLHVGDEVNIEADMLAKHLTSLMKLKTA